MQYLLKGHMIVQIARLYFSDQFQLPMSKSWIKILIGRHLGHDRIGLVIKNTSKNKEPAWKQ